MMTSSTDVTPGSGNVFEDLGFPNPQEHLTKARLVSEIAKIMKERRLTQAAAAAVFGIDPPKVSAFLDGQFQEFSVYRLMSFIAALGRNVEIVTTKVRRRPSENHESGHIIVR